MPFDHRLPSDVSLRARSPLPERDPTLGVPLAQPAPPAGEPAHRLVVIGDSLSQGFQNLAVSNTSLSWPKILADALGFPFRVPFFGGPCECPGLPLNLEAMLRALEEAHGGRFLSLRPDALLTFTRLMTLVDRYWDDGDGFHPPVQPEFNHNLAIYGWDLRDALSKDRALLQKQILDWPPRMHFYRPGVQDDGQIAALRVLAGPLDHEVTQLSAAQALGAEGIDSLVVMLGANNALMSIVTLGSPEWSGDGYDDPVAKDAYTVWRPTHFAAEYALLAGELKKVRARRVVLATVPHVTIAPLARGVGTKPTGSRYFPYYTRPWISDRDFDPGRDRYLTGDDAWAVDSAVDDYNDAIKDQVRSARRQGLDWYLFDLCGLLDSVAYRRYQDPAARPDGYEPYPLPDVLARLDPPPDTRFFVSDNGRRSQGGLIALDGVHPTTVGYSIVAAEVLRVLAAAGVPEAQDAGIDFAAMLAADTLLCRPPLSLSMDLRVLGWFSELVDWAGALFRR